MRTRLRRWTAAAALAAAGALTLASCAQVVDGTPSVANAPDADLGVQGVDPSSSFDQTAQNALSDVEAFWKVAYPKVSDGEPLPALTGGLYSVDGLKVAETKSAAGQPVAKNACAQKTTDFLVDNAAYCRLDDSIVWDRSPSHIFAELAKQYGEFTVAMIFAHEFGHAVQERLGVFDSRPPTIYTESQADCAAGAWAAAAVDGQAPHFRDITLAKVDDALGGYLNGRDSTPDNIDEISHGNGFDRLSAVADGFDKGVTYCYGKDYFSSRVFTERPYSSQSDADSGGNVPLADVIDTSSSNAFVNDLNRFWTSAARGIGKTFEPVKIAEAPHPACGANASRTQFGYCPDDNTVYFSRPFAERAYNSLPDVKLDPRTGNADLQFNQPADFGLGTMLSIGWGLAVRHQLFERDLDGKDALLAGLCYTGAYAKDINVASGSGKQFILSPADLDEGVAATLDEVPRSTAFGARGTTGLGRIQAFISGYKGGLSGC